MKFPIGEIESLINDQLTLVQVMAWCHQAPSHYLSQRWPWFLSPYVVTGPKWDNLAHYKNINSECYIESMVVTQLTHWGRDKMADILQTILSNAFSWMKIWILIKFSLKFVPKGPINNMPALFQIIAWRQVIILNNDGQFTNTYMQHSTSMS